MNLFHANFFFQSFYQDHFNLFFKKYFKYGWIAWKSGETKDDEDLVNYFLFSTVYFLVSILAEDEEVQKELLSHEISVQQIAELDEVFSIQPASVFAKILSRCASFFRNLSLVRDEVI